MGVDESPHREPLLNPIDRLTELLYGIILTLTFTGTIRVAAQAQNDARATVWAAVGCSIAWGLVDAMMYIFTAVASRNRSYRLVRAIRRDPGAARAHIVASVPPVVAGTLTTADWDKVVTALGQLPVPNRATWRREDLAGAAVIFGLANAALLPLSVPFAVLNDLSFAQHVSNGIAIVLLFACGFSLARYAGGRPVVVALEFTGFGVVLVALTIALGG